MAHAGEKDDTPHIHRTPRTRYFPHIRGTSGGRIIPALTLTLAATTFVLPGITMAVTGARPEIHYGRTPDEVVDFLRSQGKKVVTFAGFSGAEYQHNARMLKEADSILDDFNPSTTLINGGGTAAGIGQVYALARQRGFTTTGIVSSLAVREQTPLAAGVDYVFYVSDTQWGGYRPGTRSLSPVSDAMVRASDVIAGIGVGAIARDELQSAVRLGRRIRFIPEEARHEYARKRVRDAGLPAPESFYGSAACTLGGRTVPAGIMNRIFNKLAGKEREKKLALKDYWCK